MRRLVPAAYLLSLPLAACATGPRSPEQQRLDACLAKADRNIIISAQVEPGNRYSGQFLDSGGNEFEVEKFRACMEGRAPSVK
jgi:hypothetical protein